jgi:hypothetical protein
VSGVCVGDCIVLSFLTQLCGFVCREIASFSGTKVNRAVQDMFSDAGFLRRTYLFHYRQAEFVQETDGAWVRRLTVTDSDGNATEELVQTF